MSHYVFAILFGLVALMSITLIVLACNEERTKGGLNIKIHTDREGRFIAP